MAHFVHPHVIANHRRLQAVYVCRQQLRPSETFSSDSRAAFQAQNLTGQTAPGMRSQALLTLPTGPRLLLVRRLWLVYGVDVERVDVRIRVAGLWVWDGLVGRWEIRGLKVWASRVWEWGGRAVQVLTDGWQVGQPRVAVAAAIVSFLKQEEECVNKKKKYFKCVDDRLAVTYSNFKIGLLFLTGTYIDNVGLNSLN